MSKKPSRMGTCVVCGQRRKCRETNGLISGAWFPYPHSIPEIQKTFGGERDKCVGHLYPAKDVEKKSWDSNG